jgi:hypothetical protein
MTNALLRLIDWIESLPDAIRPAAYGSLVIVMFMLLKGAWLVLPIMVVFVVATSETPVADLLHGASIGMLAIVAGGLSGLAYGLVGRHLSVAIPGGRYLAGLITVAPYMFVLPLIIRLIDHEPLWTPLSEGDIRVSGIMTVIFGIVFGHSWFGPDDLSVKRRK